MTLFDDLTQLQETITRNQHLLEMRGINLGKVCFVDTGKKVKVRDINARENYVTQWLSPSREIDEVYLDDFVFYTYPTSQLEKGIYFQVVSSNHPKTPGTGGGIVNETEIKRLINEALNLYDSQITTWTTNNFVTKSAFNTEHQKTQQSFFNSFRYIAQINTYTQGGDYAIPKNWVNKCVNFIVNDTGYPNSPPQADYTPQQLTGSQTDVEYKDATFANVKYRIICNAAGNTNMPNVGDSVYIRNNSRFRMYARGDMSNVTINGSSTTEYLIPILTQWKLTKASNNAFTLTDFGFNNLPY